MPVGIGAEEAVLAAAFFLGRDSRAQEEDSLNSQFEDTAKSVLSGLLRKKDKSKEEDKKQDDGQ